LADQLDTSVEKIERALKTLADAGAIVRVSVGPQRRIFPSNKILPEPAESAGAAKNNEPAESAGMTQDERTRGFDRKLPAESAGHNKKEGNYRMSPTILAAKREAARRDLREDNS
jgi:hypothetical protein